jgi:hypothetical protein
LKQLRLIQILSINREAAARLRDVAAKVAPVNRAQRAPDASKAASGAADAAFEGRKIGILGGRRFTAR